MSMFKILALSSILMASFFMSACTSTSDILNEKYPNLIELDPPERIPYEEKKVRVDDLQVMEIRGQSLLVIQGSFPNPCSKLLRIEQESFPEILNLELVGWQKAREMCAQSITPFTYIVKDIPEEQWEQLKLVTVNGTELKLSDPTN